LRITIWLVAITVQNSMQALSVRDGAGISSRCALEIRMQPAQWHSDTDDVGEAPENEELVTGVSSRLSATTRQ
jgi:hypothetical protein